MKWLIRILGLIILFFIGLCVTGAFLPETQHVDKTINVPAEIEDVYAVVSDLQSYPEWSDFGGEASQWVFGEDEFGIGQTANWQVGEGSKQKFGSLEVLQLESNEYVRLQVTDYSGQKIITIAINENADGTTCLIQAERQFGGFPYFSRIAGLRQKKRIEARLDQATIGLANLFR